MPLDLRRISHSVRRFLIPVGIVAATVAGVTLLSSRRAPEVYQATSSMVAARSDTGNTVINNALVTAPTLPTGALQEALGSPEVLRDIQNRLNAAPLGQAEQLDLRRRLLRNAQPDGPRSLKLVSRLDEQRTGVYEVLARAATPAAARAFADATVTALMAWDTQRATDSVTRARESVERRISALDTRLNGTNQSGRADQLDLRAQLVRDREQLRVLEQAAVGSLTRVGTAQLPTEPVSPTPMRDALVAGLLSVMLLLPVVVVLDLSRRRVNLIEDLDALDLPLTVLPRFKRTVLGGGLGPALRHAQVQQQAASLRVGVWAQLPGPQLRVVAVSGLRRGDGASTVAALLAAALAEWGSRVLLIDTDPLGAGQAGLWRARTEAATHPVAVAPRVDLWRQPSLPRLSVEPRKLEALQAEWAQQYEFVILDCPPAGEIADTLLLMARASGVLLVTAPGTASQDNLLRALEQVRLVAARVMGVVMNRGPVSARPAARRGVDVAAWAAGDAATPEVAPTEALSRLP
ncbi:P-loop NTPase [Deinococcus radiotolerans]|uniref:P-loop NTPase n=1 Tax=Deinococcus radiotolerans TaxID=1309407 RepID=UPI0016650B37|nr:P-loop NTPase [Deinococcus radiotolerans]